MLRSPFIVEHTSPDGPFHSSGTSKCVPRVPVPNSDRRLLDLESLKLWNYGQSGSEPSIYSEPLHALHAHRFKANRYAKKSTQNFAFKVQYFWNGLVRWISLWPTDKSTLFNWKSNFGTIGMKSWDRNSYFAVKFGGSQINPGFIDFTGVIENYSCYVSWIIGHPYSPVSWSDFFAGISILGCFLAQPGSPGFPGFYFSLSLSLSFFLSCPPLLTGWREITQSGWSPRLCKQDW